MSDDLPLPPLATLPGKNATRQLVAEVARRVNDLDETFFDIGDRLSLNIAYETLRAIVTKGERRR